MYTSIQRAEICIRDVNLKVDNFLKKDKIFKVLLQNKLQYLSFQKFDQLESGKILMNLFFFLNLIKECKA